ncbi:hypothetical protein SAMN04515666_11943 [Bosea lupini]|uniref:Uncharacterized protein n=1 Tax=Bosea lupini TaxID=1036779 RepID=A0A1H8AFK8_9HYPH|nr:hypothetical protein SAMN04515666_11943 [Bosea lupini]
MTSCPGCRGRGFRIITQDGTRPACISCAGSGRLAPLAVPPPAAAAAAGHLPPARAPSLTGRRPFSQLEPTR